MLVNNRLSVLKLAIDNLRAAEIFEEIDFCAQCFTRCCLGYAQVFRADAEGELFARLHRRGVERRADLASADAYRAVARPFRSQQVHPGRADETGDKSVCRVLVDLAWAAGLLDAAIAQDH